jgi:hypothetical protein
MVWAKIDDGILDNPKIARVGLFGFAIHVAGIVWSCRNLTDGFIPVSRCGCLLDVAATSRELISNVGDQIVPINDEVKADVGKLVSDRTHPSALVIIATLVDAGLWREADGGYVIHDFLQYNPSRADVLGKKEKDAARNALKRTSKSSKRVARDIRATSEVSHSGIQSESRVNPEPPDPLSEISSGFSVLESSSEIQSVTGMSTGEDPPSEIRLVPSSAAADGAFGSLVSAWAGGVRSVGYPDFRGPWGTQAGRLAEVLRAKCAGDCNQAHELGAEYARAHAGRVLTHFAFIDWVGSSKPAAGGRAKALVQPAAPPEQRAWQVGNSSGGRT